MSKQARKNRLLPILLITAAPLIAGAVYLRTAPARAERTLQQSTYNQLVEAVKRDPGNPRVFYYFGLRNRDLGRLGPAHAALSRASELDPDSEDIALARASIAGELQSDQETFETLTAFLKRHPDSTNTHWALALFYAANDEASRSYQEALTVTKQRPQDAKAWRLAGMQALLLGIGNRAEEELRHAVALDPHDWRNQYGLGEALTSQRLYPEALTAYQAAAAQAPNEPMVLIRYGLAQLKSAADPNAIQQAVQTLTRAVQQSPNDPLANLSLGQAQMRAGNVAEAQKALLVAERLSPWLADTHNALEQLYQAQHDTANAEREARRLQEAKNYERERDQLRAQLAQVGFDPAIGLKLARLYAAHGDATEAAQQYHHLLGDPSFAPLAQREMTALAQQNPQIAAHSVALPLLPASAQATGEAPALLHDADLLLTKQQVSQAADAYLSILKQAPNSAPAYQGLGLAESAMGQTDKAFRAFSQALRLDPSLPQAQFGLAQLYSAAGLPDEASARLERLIRQVPNSAEYLNALGNIYRADEVTYSQAETLFRRAVALAPNQPDTLVNLADMESSNNKPQAAEAHYRQALQLAPQSVRTQVALGRFLLTQQTTPEHAAEAERLLRSALTQDPRNDTAQVYLGQLLVQRGDAKDAVPLLESAVLHAPNRKEPWYNLARAYDLLHNRERATYCYTAFRNVSGYITDLGNTEEAARTQPKNPALRLKLARLYAQGGKTAKAINQYQNYLALRPKETAVQKELAAYIQHLKAAGAMPDIGLFNQMVLASVKLH
jgi:tetratricopeptide (TPR) repeat protein